MRRSVFFGCLLAYVSSGLALGCGDDSGGGEAGSGGGGGGRGGSGVQDDPLNAECPNLQGPFTMEDGLKGDCCYRTSNTSRLAEMTGDTATLEYRLTSFLPNNHPNTISSALIEQSTIDRFDLEQQHLLFRFTLPREDGEWVAGEGTAEIGAGRYNCDGTYSFYSDTAAPVTDDLSARDRWAASKVPVRFDPEADSWQEQSETVWATNTNREVTYLPYVFASGMGLEWEAASQGFNIIEMPPLEEALNCIGSRKDVSSWEAGGKTVSYQRLDLNNESAISVLSNISLAQLQAFGSFVTNPNNPDMNKDAPAYNPLMAERCQPGSAGCLWKKLPDSLCPVTDVEKSRWGCHVGDPNNEDGVETNCTPDAPDMPLDPDKGATSEGQCCDPLAKETNGLPACNAYRLVSEFSAAATEITDEPADSLQPKCNPEGGVAN